MTKIKTNFTAFEQQLFLSSFYCYLNYHPNKDFVIDLDDVWKWIGYTNKVKATALLEKNFTINIDYKNLAPEASGATNQILLSHSGKQENKHGGHNIKKYLLNIKTFKSFCLKAGTKKAAEIHNYYMKLEEVLQETIEEESHELKLQLQNKENIILEIKQSAEQQKEAAEQEKEIMKQTAKKEKQRAVEQEIINLFPVNTECIYFGTIENTNEQNEKLIKFGHTNDLQTRLYNHRKIYTNFALVKAFRVQNKVEIENLIKTDPKIKKHIRSIEVSGKNKTEIIAYDAINFTIERLARYIQDIIHSKTYSIDNFNRIMKENEEHVIEIKLLQEQIKKHEDTINQLGVELNEVREKLKNQTIVLTTVQEQHESVFTSILLPDNELTDKFNKFVDTCCIVRADVEELSMNIEGRFRLWNKDKMKPTKEAHHALKHYLDVRFKPKKIDGGSHGYVGIKLIPIVYKKRYQNLDVENFIFQECKFSDSGRIANSVLLQEYQKWKTSIGLVTESDDITNLKEYLNFSPFAIKSTIWTDKGTNDGYYGISLKDEIYKPKLGATTGKKVEKRLVGSNTIIKSWNSIAEAALHETMNKATMSRNVKEKRIIGEYYYSHPGSIL